MIQGTIARIDQRGFGFIAGDNGLEYFFPAKEVRGYQFDSLTVGSRVSFKPVSKPYNNKGPRALTVTPLVPQQVAA